MVFTIIIPYRPSTGGMNSIGGEIWQDENYKWNDASGVIDSGYVGGQESIVRCVQALRKNSVHHHKIVIAMDFDMHHKDGWLSEHDVTFFNSEWTASDGSEKIPQNRQMHTYYEAIQSIGDDDVVAYAYIDDVVCGKRWDAYVVKAIEDHGMGMVYAPLFIEPRTVHGSHTWSCGEHLRGLVEPMGETTSENIWGKWRGYCCHSPTMRPPVDRDYAVEADLDEWSAACNDGGKDVIIEPCGVRNYGYWAPIIAKNKVLKEHSEKMLIGFGGDLAFEGSLGEKCVVCRSHVFHLHYGCILDESEVVHG